MRSRVQAPETGSSRRLSRGARTDAWCLRARTPNVRAHAIGGPRGSVTRCLCVLFGQSAIGVSLAFSTSATAKSPTLKEFIVSRREALNRESVSARRVRHEATDGPELQALSTSRNGSAGASIEDYSAALAASPLQLSALDRSLLQFRAAVRGREQAPGAQSGQVHEAAGAGVQGSGSTLPHLATIQKAFGRHDVTTARAYVGDAANQATEALGARAYAMNDSVVLGSRGTDLHTVAHEAAHVVQQRGGVALKGGVGEVGDRYEVNADAVADAVVRGESAEALLNPYAGGASTAGGVQRAVQLQDNETEEEKAEEEEAEAEDSEAAKAQQQSHLAKTVERYAKWVMSNCIIPEDKTFLYVKNRLGRDPRETLDLYSKSNPPTDDLSVVLGGVAESCSWIPVAAKVMSVVCMAMGAVATIPALGAATAVGATSGAVVDLAFTGKWVLDACNFVYWNFVVDSEYPEFDQWLRFQLGFKRRLIREWGAAEGVEVTENLIQAIQKTVRNSG